nr:oxysterol-binding protein-related protein 2a [Quercus suber]
MQADQRPGGQSPLQVDQLQQRMEIQVVPLRNGFLSYTKIRRMENFNLLMSPTSDDITLIREISANRLSRLDSSGKQKHH